MSLKFNSHDAFYDQKRPLQAQTSKYRVSMRLLCQKVKKMARNIASYIADQQYCQQYGCIISNIANNIVGNIAESAILLAMLSAILMAILLNYKQYCWIINIMADNIADLKKNYIYV